MYAIDPVLVSVGYVVLTTMLHDPVQEPVVKGTKIRSQGKHSAISIPGKHASKVWILISVQEISSPKGFASLLNALKAVTRVSKISNNTATVSKVSKI